MSRINTNVQSLVAVNNLTRANEDLNQALVRLSSGMRINSAADDPSGLIMSEALRGEKASINRAIDNSTRAGNIVATAEGALNEVSSLLVSIKDLVTEAANAGGLSESEIAANQLAIDSAVASITRIAKTTRFGGQNLLNGDLAFRTSGVDSTKIAGLKLYSVEFGGNSSVHLTVNVTTSAKAASLVGISAATTSAASFEVGGALGSEVFSFAAGTGTSTVVAAINNFTAATGVSAVLNTSGTKMTLYSTAYGSDAFVSLRQISGNLTKAGGTYAKGQDAAGSINGMTAVGKGLELTLKSAVLDAKVTLKATVGTGSEDFYVTGGGATFQIGSLINPNGQVRMSIDSATAGNLGNGNVGYLSDVITGGSKSIVSGKAGEAAKIVDAAIDDVASERGRLGAFVSNTVSSSVNSLKITLENVTAAESAVRDSDFSAEAAAMTRAQILLNAGTSVLAIANAVPRTVLALLS
jgi:flagellin